MKFDHSHYVPILKGKQGELNALKNTDAKLFKKFTPLIEVPPIPKAYPEDGPPVLAKTIDKHVKDVSANFVKVLAALPSVFVDAVYIETEDDLKDGISPVDSLFVALRKGNVSFIPTVGLDRVEDYADSVKNAIETDGRGCCLRLLEADLEGIAELGAQIDSLLAMLNAKPDSIDLLVDFRAKVPSKAFFPFLIDALPRLAEWRTLTVASSSFPQDMSEVGKNKIDELDREDWLAWLFVRSKQKSMNKRVPTFADYAINHPVLAGDLDPRMMNMSPNIRYTDSLNYVVAKGQAQPRKKWAKTAEKKAIREQLAPSVQYPKLATMVKGHSSWKGPQYSWGDKFIDQCSQQKCVGSATDWRAVGTSHHIAVVVQQLANLP
ncbi:MAG: beta family protein [Acidobacteriia bacterium]|nr:beta family protein [Terriglobia bacterium]